MNVTPEESANSTTGIISLLSALQISIFLTNVLLGFPICSYIVWLIVRGTGNGVVSEFFNLNLFVCEIGYCIDCLLSLLSLAAPSLLTVSESLTGLGVTGRPLFQYLICFERYLAVVHPVIFLKTKPLRYRVICCAVAWITILGSCFCSMITLSSHNYSEFSWFLSIQFVVFFLLQMFCLVSVLRALKQSGPGERRKDGDEENHMKRRAFHLIFLTTVGMVVTFVPLIILGFLSVPVNSGIEMHKTLGLAGFTLSGFVQPVLYLHRIGKLSYCSLLKTENQ